MKVLLSSLLFSFSLFAFEGEFKMETYLDLCGHDGDAIYANCDSDEVNQITMIEHARETALERGTLILTVFGAEWCKGCQGVAYNMKQDKRIQKLKEAGHILLKINADTISGKKAKELLGLEFSSIPHFTIIGSEESQVFDESDLDMPSSNSMDYLLLLFTEAEIEFQQ